MVVVTSSNSPRFSVNPNNGYLLSSADSGPFITANNVLYHSAQYPSHFTLPIVSMKQLPELHDVKGIWNKAYPHIDADAFLPRDLAKLLLEIQLKQNGAK